MRSDTFPFSNETTQRKSENRRHPKSPPGHGNGDNFFPKKITVPLRWSWICRCSTGYKGAAPPGLRRVGRGFFGKK
ncbi:MAG: hypothetical protein D6714_18300 [Bacteroidetes bacterium]|nr:MAG: hypothetical protein D6714_18300 [Bacteroidota bacterium]